MARDFLLRVRVDDFDLAFVDTLAIRIFKETNIELTRSDLVRMALKDFALNCKNKSVTELLKLKIGGIHE